MCGDLEDEERARLEAEFYARFLTQARALLKDGEAARQQPSDLADYMERFFKETLGRAVEDDETAEPAQRYERLSVQPVVLARLAGLLAGHLSLGEDPLRKVMEALMLGYSEAGSVADAQDPSHHYHGDVYVGSRR